MLAICQVCQRAAATQHITERLPSGLFTSAHYCTPCHTAALAAPNAATAHSPAPTWTRKDRVIVVAALLMPLCIVAGYLFSALGMPHLGDFCRLCGVLALGVVLLVRPRKRDGGDGARELKRSNSDDIEAAGHPGLYDRDLDG